MFSLMGIILALSFDKDYNSANYFNRFNPKHAHCFLEFTKIIYRKCLHILFLTYFPRSVHILGYNGLKYIEHKKQTGAELNPA